ncbi:DUF6431 domain-containing protein [Lentibacillus sp.]|uniref:DUF6431 domain-containing protein n=1 Tax=Lentibacillus sp. TaxID=1925746 RepID=UPI0039C9BD9E
MAGSRPRVWCRSSGKRDNLIIRRLYCEKCKDIHHELPDVFIPYTYKHYLKTRSTGNPRIKIIITKMINDQID